MEASLESEDEEKEKIISECLKWEIELKRLERELRVKKERNLGMTQHNRLLEDKLMVVRRRKLRDKRWRQALAARDCRVGFRRVAWSKGLSIHRPQRAFEIELQTGPEPMNLDLDTDLNLQPSTSDASDCNSNSKSFKPTVVLRSVENCEENEMETTDQETSEIQEINVSEILHQGSGGKDEIAAKENLHFCTKKYQCQYCQKCYYSPSHLKNHLRTHTGERPFVCDKIGCGWRFSRNESLKFHINFKHSDERPFQCNENGCGKTFKTRSNLGKHHKQHTKNFQCQVCQRCCNSLSNLQAHLRTHTDERPFECNWVGCGKRFKIKSNLKEHVSQKHSNERPFQCNENDCGKTFKTKSILQTHLKQHSSDRPFKCTENGCDKTFIRKSIFKKHFKHHSSARPFQCKENDCGKSYKTKDDLKLHIREFHSSIRFQCQVKGCGKLIKRERHLKTHVKRVHSDVREFRCDFENCGKTFKTEFDLNRHKKIHQS